MKNYYAILEVPVGSDISEIREAYRRLVPQNMWNKEVFAELKEAYEVLSTPGRRREYDQANFGQSFGEGETMTSGNRETDRRCPFQAGQQCPVINARVTPGDTFCPECGFLLAAMPSEGFVPVATETDITQQPRFEETAGDRMHRLHVGVNSVGREAADILLTDKTVSRRHAQVELAETGEAFVEDLGSTNGTRIFETILPPHDRRPLTDGDTVRFGSVSLVLRLPQAKAQQTPGEFSEPSPGVMVPDSPADFSTPFTGFEAVPEPSFAATEPSFGAAEPSLAATEPSLAASEHPDLGVPAPEEQTPPLATLLGQRHGAPVRKDHLVPGVTTFGRRAENTIILRDDPYVSGVHAQIIAGDGSFRLTDLGSTNGTFLNEVRLVPNEPSTLHAGDKISIGGLTYTFEPADSASAPESLPEPAPSSDPEEMPMTETPMTETPIIEEL